MHSLGRVVGVMLVASVALLFLANEKTVGEPGAGPPMPSLWTDEGDQYGAGFGVGVCNAGDVNGDGHPDLVIGAYLYDNPEHDEGRVLAYYGTGTGLPLTPSWSAEIDVANASFGNDVKPAGDVNGDGYADVIVAACAYTDGEAGEGAAFVYQGSASGLSTTPDWSVEVNQEGARLAKVDGAGDVNGDGYDDVIVGALLYDSDSTSTDVGKAYVYYGGPSGLSSTPAWTVEGDSANSQLGYSVAGAGDVNGDGYSDIVVGAPGPPNDHPVGRVYGFYGSPFGLSVAPDWVAVSDQFDSRFGGQVADAGDVNGDGYSDVIIGASAYSHGQWLEGAAFLYYGGPLGLSPVAGWIGEPDQEKAGFGSRVAGAGDLTGDGYPDVIVCAYQYSTVEVYDGRVFVYAGGPLGLSTAPVWSVPGDQGFAHFGVGLSGAGDINSDGYDDYAVGAFTYDSPDADEGKVFVYGGMPAVPAPVISSVIDYPQDDGGKVILSWKASFLDNPPHHIVTHYSVWRRYLGGGASLTADMQTLEGNPLSDQLDAETMALLHGWEYVADSPARYLPEYAMTVPTYADSSASGIPYCAFIVMAHTEDRWTFWTSAPDTGYSVDNLPPECPTALAGQVADETQIILTWRGSRSADLSHYAIYRGALEDFSPGMDTFVAITADTVFVDGQCSGRSLCYKVSAVDVHGNESQYALLTSDQIAGSSGGVRGIANLLYQNEPNPFGASTKIAFSIKAPAHVRLRVFDARGRLVRVLVDEARQPNQYVESWDGTDSAGRDVASGAYFCRLELPGWTAARKMLLAR